ncbi:MAG: hypothetical protein IJ689_07935 [Alphaproteobacteria bacterium]|nr:hypothetical protein [Alphaproteobacteria bacterium]MBR1649505.1 hypothetical protein [Alphaproteobacteria bacterium]
MDNLVAFEFEDFGQEPVLDLNVNRLTDDVLAQINRKLDILLGTKPEETKIEQKEEYSTEEILAKIRERLKGVMDDNTQY